MDYHHDPAKEPERHFWWDFFERKRALEKQIGQWEAVAAPNASELAQKESRLKELRQELARMEAQEGQSRSDYYPAPDTTKSPGADIAYPRAMKLLADRLGATPEELAAWVWLGPKQGGLAAYVNAKELDPPPQFSYRGDWDGFDYVSPLMACWFVEDDLARFEPADRYIKGKALIERWSAQPGIRAEAFIQAKIAESRLLDAHPTFGCTQGTCPEEAIFPPLEDGLFALSYVEAIEAEDFGMEQCGQAPPDNSSPTISRKAGHLNHDPEMQRRANEIAAAKKKETGRPLTRNRVAKLLATELEMDEATVLRRIRKQW